MDQPHAIIVMQLDRLVVLVGAQLGGDKCLASTAAARELRADQVAGHVEDLSHGDESDLLKKSKVQPFTKPDQLPSREG